MRYSNGYVDPRDLALACRADAVLRRWIRPQWLDPSPLREQALARPLVRWCSADDFFQPAALDALAEQHAQMDFEHDDVGLNYHSEAVRVDGHPEITGVELLLHPLWHAYAAFAMGATLSNPGRTVIKYRSHPAWAHGFWVHTDRDDARPKALAVLGFLNDGWRADDGGLLQLWDTQPADNPDADVLRWDDYVDKPLDFLNDRIELTIEAADVVGYRVLHARLLDQIVPRSNRVVFLDFQSTPSFHSVSPSRERVRRGFLQWLY